MFDTVTDTLKLYINGVLKDTNSTFTSTFDISTKPVNIGGQPTDYQGWANGKIYNAMIYNRALSASEIKQNYNATKGRYGL